MALPVSGAMSLSQIATEFGKTPPLNLSSLYAIVSGIPAAGEMSLSSFYGKAAGSANTTTNMTVGSLRNAADGKLTTVASTMYGFSAASAIGSLSVSAYRAYPFQDIVYIAFDNGQKFLVITVGLGWNSESTPGNIPANYAKRVKFAGGATIDLPTVSSGNATNMFYTWSPPTAGCHNVTVVNGSTYQKNVQYIVSLSSAPFPLSGVVGVTLDYDP